MRDLPHEEREQTENERTRERLRSDADRLHGTTVDGRIINAWPRTPIS